MALKEETWMRPVSRRGFLRTAGLGGLTLPLWFPRVAFSAAPSAERDVLVCVFLRGGADALNLVVPFGDEDYYRSRTKLACRPPGSSGFAALDLDGFFGFHPHLAPLAELYADGVLAVVHATGSPDLTHSHFDAMDFMERGTPGSKSIPTGWIGRHLATLDTGNDSPFRAVGMGAILPASLRGPVPATALRSIAGFHLQGPPGQDAELARFQARLSSLYAGTAWLDRQARQAFDTVAALAAAHPGTYQPGNGARYPSGDFGMALLQVAQLLKADVGLEVASVDLDGWDAHSGQGTTSGTMADAVAELAGGLAAFYTDLGDRMRRVTVVTLSEFGRRVKENSSGGTDHGHGGAMLLLGGGIRGGRVFGTWPGLAPEQLIGPGDLAITTDYRTVLAEVLERRLGNAMLGDVFPGFTVPDYLGVA
jgi:uncharacterized protein (DUF1501 family)